MKTLKRTFILLLLPIFAFTAAHKYYVSVTHVEYVKEKQSLQIITNVFVDDFERLLRERYDENITLSIPNELSTVEMYTKRYLNEKIQIHINGKLVTYNYLGKEYENDVIYFYLEVENVKEIKSFAIENLVLQDLFEEQENVIRTKINGKNKSFILRKGNNKGELNYN